MSLVFGYLAPQPQSGPELNVVDMRPFYSQAQQGPSLLFFSLQFLNAWVPSPLPGLVHRDSTCRPGCQASTLALLEMMLWPAPCLADLGELVQVLPSLCDLSLSVVVWERCKMLPVPL